MAVVNYKNKEITAKIVYYGPGQSGKTTNLQVIYSKIKPENRGKLTTLATQTDRTLFFDFLPVDFGEIRGYKVKFQIYTVPGQVFYNSTRKLLLKNVDGVVFVADSSEKMLDENKESLQNLEDNLKFYGVRITDIPLVIQYNKRDLPDALPIEVLERELNPRKVPYFKAIANKGVGVLETLAAIIKMVLHKLKTAPEIVANETPLEDEGVSNIEPPPRSEPSEREIEPEEAAEKLKQSFNLTEDGKLEVKEEELEEDIDTTLDEFDEELEIELEDEEEEVTQEEIMDIEDLDDVEDVEDVEDIDKTLAEVESLLAEEEEEAGEIEESGNFQIIEALPTIDKNQLVIPIKLKRGNETIELKVTVELKE